MGYIFYETGMSEEEIAFTCNLSFEDDLVQFVLDLGCETLQL